MTNSFKPSITILSIDNNVKHIRASMTSCQKLNCFDKVILCHNNDLSFKDCGVEEIKGFNQITSAINRSMALTSSDLNIFIMSGCSDKA